jgi:hypothetical protein
MLVAFARNQTLVARKGTGVATAYTDPQPVGDSTYCESTLNVSVLFGTDIGTPGTVTLTAAAYGSNDMSNWFPIPTLLLSKTSTGTLAYGEYVTCVFLRFKLTIETTAGDDDDIAVATFDLHANLTRK